MNKKRKNTVHSILLFYALAFTMQTTIRCAETPSELPEKPEFSLPTEQPIVPVASSVSTAPKKKTVRFHSGPTTYTDLIREKLTPKFIREDRLKLKQKRLAQKRSDQSAARTQLHESHRTAPAGDDSTLETDAQAAPYDDDDDFTSAREREEKLTVVSTIQEFEKDPITQDKDVERDAHDYHNARCIGHFMKLSKLAPEQFKDALFPSLIFLGANHPGGFRALFLFIIEMLLERQLIIDQTLLAQNLDTQITELEKAGAFRPQFFQELLKEFLEKYEYDIPLM